MAWYDYLADAVSPVAMVGHMAGVGASDAKDYLGQVFSKPPSQYGDHDYLEKTLQGGINGADRTAPQAANNSPFAGYQLQQVGQLQRIASGQQQGAGELAAQRQTNNGMAAQQALARMGRGPNAALAARNAMNTSAQVGLAGAGQAQQSALQDQQNAQGLLTQALGQGRSQDQQMALANLDAQLRMQGMNDAQRAAYLQALMGMNQGELAGAQGADQAQKNLFGGILSAGGQVAGAAMGKKG